MNVNTTLVVLAIDKTWINLFFVNVLVFQLKLFLWISLNSILELDCNFKLPLPSISLLRPRHFMLSTVRFHFKSIHLTRRTESTWTFQLHSNDRIRWRGSVDVRMMCSIRWRWIQKKNNVSESEGMNKGQEKCIHHAHSSICQSFTRSQFGLLAVTVTIICNKFQHQEIQVQFKLNGHWDMFKWILMYVLISFNAKSRCVSWVMNCTGGCE